MISPPPLIGVSPSMSRIKDLINHVAKTCPYVLITGETGVGKDVVAQNLYAESNRSDNNFVKINCAALPETLLESELYGYEKGAFTDAHKKRQGKFLTADKGVLFLDEIGDMPFALQSKMLHVLQSGEFSPLGSDRDFKTDVWVIAATNQCLEENIKSKTFREDLFYRLNIIKIDIPPLRERPEDIPVLVEYFFKKYMAKYPETQAERPDNQTMARLCSYHWPGNIRQLQNCIKKQMVFNCWDKISQELSDDDTIPSEMSSSEQIPQMPSADSTLFSSAVPFYNETGNHRHRIISEFVDLSTSYEKLFNDISLKKIKKLASDKVEKEVMTFVLDKVGWNRAKAAKILKISYKTLLYKISEFEMNPPVNLKGGRTKQEACQSRI